MLIVAFILAMQMLVVHGPDGHEVYINPTEVVGLHDYEQNKSKPDLNCVVSMTDGKILGTKETCTAIREQLEKLQ